MSKKPLDEPKELYSHAYDVPDSEMGKSEDRMSNKSLQALNDLSSVVEKSQRTDKANLGTLQYDAGAKKMTFGGKEAEGLGIAGKEPGKVGDVHFKFPGEGEKKEGKTGPTPPPLPKDASVGADKAMPGGIGSIGGGVKGGSGGGGLVKAMTASAMPAVRGARLRAGEMDIHRSATMGMTRGNAKFAKDVHTGPLCGEVIEQVEEDAVRRTKQPIHKSCLGCGRRYIIKSMNDSCPTCALSKSHMCQECGYQLVKSHGGFAFCPICG